MTVGNTPADVGGIPLSSVMSPGNTGQVSGGNVIPVPLQGHPGSYLDSANNPSTAAMMAMLYPQIVQKTNNVTGSAGKTLNKAFTNNNNQGNSIIVALGMGEVDNGSTITLAVTDSAGNTYTRAGNPATQSTTLEAAIFYATNIAAGANTVTVTIAGASSTNTAIAMEIYEVWGTIAVASDALDQTATGNNAGSTTPATSAITPYVPNELAFVALSAAGGTITAGTGWTLDSGSLSPTGGNLVSFGSESQLLSTLASTTGSATLSGSNAWAICMATFKTVIVPIAGTVSEVNSASILAVEGATGDAAVVGDNTGSLSAKLRGLTKILNDIWDSVNHLFHFNLKQVGGTAVDTNSGNKSAGTQRVVIATDQPALSNAQPVSGTVTANAGTGTFTNQQSNITTDYDTGAGTQTMTMFGVALPASGGSAAGGTSSNPVRTDPTGTTTQPVSGTVTANAGTGNFDAASTSGGTTPSHTISAASTNATSLKASAGHVYGFIVSNTNAAARFFKIYNKASAPTVGTDTPVVTVHLPPNSTVIRVYPKGLALGTGIAWALTTGIANSDTGSVGTDISVDIDYL